MASEKLSNLIESLDISENKENREVLSKDDSRLFINLKSKDGYIVRVLRKNAIISDLVKVAIEGDTEADEVLLPGIDGDILKSIVEYMNRKKGDNTVVVSKPLKVTMEDSCTPAGKWEAEFINKVAEDKKRIHTMVMAANYMAINSLLHMACARVGLGLKGKSKEKMMEELNLSKA